MSFLLSLAKKMTTFRPTPLPTFDHIDLTDVPPASILLFYGGTELTEIFGNYVYKHPYAPAAFHTAGYIGEGKVLNIGAKATIEDVRSMYRSTRRIDVITLNDLTDEERKIICRKFERDAGCNFYDAVGYVRLGGKLKALRFLKYVKSSEKDDFCSDNVVDNFSELPLRRKSDTDEIFASLILPRFINVSYFSGEDTAPWHLLEYAMDKGFQGGTRAVRTLWIGPDFKTP